MKIKEVLEHLVTVNDKVGIRILPNKRAKYMIAFDMYRECEIAKAYAKNGAIVFVVSHAEAVKHGLVKED